MRASKVARVVVGLVEGLSMPPELFFVLSVECVNMPRKVTGVVVPLNGLALRDEF